MTNKIIVNMTCPFCGARHSVKVDEEKWIEYLEGNDLIQNIFPELSTTEREQLISFLCPVCQKTFKNRLTF